MKKVTVTDIARELGVTPSTVSRALSNKNRISEKTKKLVLKTAKKLGYAPNIHARRLQGGPANCIGVCCSKGLETPEVDYYMLELLQSLVQSSAKSSFSLELINTGNKEKLLQMLETRQIDGLIIIDDNPQECGKIANFLANYPCVLIGHSEQAKQKRTAVVAIDNESGSRMATKHLIDSGHKRIGFIRGVPGNPKRDDKYEGFSSEMEKGGCKILAKAIVNAGPTIDGAMKAAKILLKSKVTAVLCETDWIALGLIHTLKELGIAIPDDLSVVGFNDTAFSAYISPSLTTVRIPGNELAEAAVNLLTQLIKNKISTGYVIVGTELICRKSTARRSKLTSRKASETSATVLKTKSCKSKIKNQK